MTTAATTDDGSRAQLEAASVLLREIMAALGAAAISRALVRTPSRDGRGQLEADVIVAPGDLAATEQLLAEHGLRRRPGWGRRPHRFHVRPARADDGTIDWLKVDVVTDLCFGAHHELASDMGPRCLAARPDPQSDRLLPADELMALLLHALLDRPIVRVDQRERLAELAVLARADGPGPLAHRCLPTGANAPTWTEILDALESGDTRLLDQLRPHLRQRLEQGRRLRVGARRMVATSGRHSAKLLTAVAARGPLVAFVGPDGTGKTTAAAAVADASGLPARVLYGGTYRSGTSSSSLPGFTTAKLLGRLLGTRAQLTWHRSRGRLVVLDRHPVQAKPTADDHHSRRTNLRRRVVAATLPRPDLLLALDAPATVLHDRRPEHTIERLDDDRHRTLALARATPGSAIVDATHSPDSVRDETVRLVWDRAVPVAPGRSRGRRIPALSGEPR